MKLMPVSIILKLIFVWVTQRK
ncbi:Protein of unknown function [Cotesia congregata]|uniref:Uncharacterized protein n=1 Tax=Cotesia congregata TaxID=51543 RepID=A0A8J2EBV6_COTCN|nr:Protein of unknown function [Cotesia congregata]